MSLRTFIIGTVVAAGFALPATAGPIGFCEIGVATCVIDAETLKVDGVLVRLSNIDAPEVRRPGCAMEAALSYKAAERLVELMNASVWHLERDPATANADRDGLPLRRLVGVEGDLGDVLVSEGLARPSSGQQGSWC